MARAAIRSAVVVAHSLLLSFLFYLVQQMAAICHSHAWYYI